MNSHKEGHDALWWVLFLLTIGAIFLVIRWVYKAIVGDDSKC